MWTNLHQFASICINLNQFAPISINFHPICTNLNQLNGILRMRGGVITTKKTLPQLEHRSESGANKEWESNLIVISSAIDQQKKHLYCSKKSELQPKIKKGILIARKHAQGFRLAASLTLTKPSPPSSILIIIINKTIMIIILNNIINILNIPPFSFMSMFNIRSRNIVFLMWTHRGFHLKGACLVFHTCRRW